MGHNRGGQGSWMADLCIIRNIKVNQKQFLTHYNCDNNIIIILLSSVIIIKTETREPLPHPWKKSCHLTKLCNITCLCTSYKQYTYFKILR